MCGGSCKTCGESLPGKCLCCEKHGEMIELLWELSVHAAQDLQLFDQIGADATEIRYQNLAARTTVDVTSWIENYDNIFEELQPLIQHHRQLYQVCVDENLFDHKPRVPTPGDIAREYSGTEKSLNAVRAWLPHLRQHIRHRDAGWFWAQMCDKMMRLQAWLAHDLEANGSEFDPLLENLKMTGKIKVRVGTDVNAERWAALPHTNIHSSSRKRLVNKDDDTVGYLVPYKLFARWRFVWPHVLQQPSANWLGCDQPPSLSLN